MASNWNSSPPKGAPMVAVPFLGPWYPPDVPAGSGYKPTPPSNAVIGLKRTLGRLGAWPWDPSGYDSTYSNAFAHGSSNGPGVAGVQKWAGLQPSGWIGPATFNFLRSVLISAQMANGGQHAIDSKAAQLLAQGPPPPPEPTPVPPSSSPRETALAHLQARLGFTEQPANSNFDDRSNGIKVAQRQTAGGGTWLDRQPWCGCWCFYALQAAGVKGIDSHLASVAQIEQYAKQGAKCYRGWTGDRSKVKKGDLVVIGGRGVHVETVRGFDGSNTLTIGGNTSSGSSGSQSNGGGSFQRSRSPSEVYGYALVKYPGE